MIVDLRPDGGLKYELDGIWYGDAITGLNHFCQGNCWAAVASRSSKIEIMLEKAEVFD